MSDEVSVIAVGIVHLSVCADAGMAVDDVLDAANRAHPTGLDHGWMVSLDSHFATGHPNPCKCEQDASRVHRLLVC